MTEDEWTDDEIDLELFGMIKCLSDGTEFPELTGEVPVSQQIKYLEEISNKSKITRRCHNPECNWEGFVEVDLRFCPACEWEIVGWKSEKHG